jgi:iron complex transport system substrate-binding protein
MSVVVSGFSRTRAVASGFRGRRSRFGEGGRRTVIVLAVLMIVSSTTAVMQTRFVDDAKRDVQLPPRVGRVFAAGAPAEVLLYTLVPEMLVGRNRVPEGDAVEFFPPAYRTPVFIKQLPEVDNPSADAELVALKPDVYIDYGTVHEDYIASVNAVQQRTRVPGIILDGALTRIPDTYRRLGTALGVGARGESRAAAADRILTKYRGALSATSSAPRVYLACSADGFAPCLEDDSAGEQLKWLGGVNVAGTRATAPKRPLTIEEIKALNPRAIVVTGGAGAAARLRANAAWQSVDAVMAGRVYQYPGLPYSWGARPPSVNRLPGLMWLAYVAVGRTFDAEFDADVRAFYRDFYHLELADPQLRKLLGGS